MRLHPVCTITLLLLFSLDVHAAERWFNTAIVDKGAMIFQQNCAACHGANAEGTSDWKKPDANGKYPPPPLDGSAHAWHHSISQLARQIKQGGIKLGGVMPGFGTRLQDPEVLAVIAYFQSKWPDKIYQAWHDRHLQ